MRLIDADELKRKYAGWYNIAEKDKSIYCVEAKEINWMPTVDAVPLEPLARFIVENLDPRVDCESCVSDFENADRDCRNCPRMSEEQVLGALKKWMEKQQS